jgi:UrcA family protein
MRVSTRFGWITVLPLGIAAVLVSSLAAAAGSRQEVPVVAVVVSAALTPGTEEITTPLITVAPNALISAEVVGVASTGWPIDKVTMRLNVSYADLDLATAGGTAELHRRIVKGAYQACDYLTEYYPNGDYGGSDLPAPPGYAFTNDDCVKSAIDNANAASAAARLAASDRSSYR